MVTPILPPSKGILVLRHAHPATLIGGSGLRETRVADLLTLEFYLLRAFARWAELMLVTKTHREELTLVDVHDTRTRVDSYLGHAATALEELRSANTRVIGRSWLDKLLSDGLLLGAFHDEDVERDAKKRRKAIQKAAASARLAPLCADGVLCLDVPATRATEPKPLQAAAARN